MLENLIDRLLVNLKLRKPSNSHFLLFKRALKVNRFHIKYDEVYYIQGFEYDKKRYDEIVKAITDNSFCQKIKSLTYNAQSDNIDFYYIVNRGQHMLVSLLDFIDVDKNEKILDKFKVIPDHLDKCLLQRIY